MQCLKCGYCCIALQVNVIKNPEFPLSKKNVIHKKGGVPCPHLLGSKPGEHSCAIHNSPWYKYTVCFRYNQHEPDCIIGYYYMKQKERENATD
jgi:hypothetical protein